MIFLDMRKNHSINYQSLFFITHSYFVISKQMIKIEKKKKIKKKGKQI